MNFSQARSIRIPAAAVLLAWAAAAAAAAPAEPLSARENLVSFSAEASVELTQDLLGITLQAVREGKDAAAVQAQIKQVLEAALAQARKSEKAGAMDVRTGGFSLYPRHDKDGRIAGWQGQAELVLEGRDGELVARTAGSLGGLNVTSVDYRLSRELSERHRADVTAQAIQRFRAQAAELATQFGFTGYVLREVSVQSSGSEGSPRPMAYRGKAELAAMSADAAVPVAPGKGSVSTTVSGSVQLTR